LSTNDISARAVRNELIMRRCRRAADSSTLNAHPVFLRLVDESGLLEITLGVTESVASSTDVIYDDKIVPVSVVVRAEADEC
jgi:hypothetical protein